MRKIKSYLIILGLFLFVLSSCGGPLEVTVSFDTNGGSYIESMILNEESPFTLPNDPTKEGHSFLGWYLDDTLETPFSVEGLLALEPVGSYTVYASWQVNQYTITFDPDNGSPITSITQDYGTVITAPANPTKTNFLFLGWNPSIPSTMPAFDMNLKAIWEYDPIALGTAPVYQGMDVTAVSSVSAFPQRYYNWSFEDSNIIDDIPTIDIPEQPDIVYYSARNEDVYVRVILDNPDSQVILRFTLNGVVYQSFEFEEGSTSELLIVKVNAGDLSGIRELTIDEIKYIENVSNLTKDADFEGDRTITMAVTYDHDIEATISEEVVTSTSYRSVITINDPDNLSVIYENAPVFYLSDGTNIIYTQTLTNGNNIIEYPYLHPSQTYVYAVATTYDLLDGEGAQVRIASTKGIETNAIVSLETIEAFQEALSFNITPNDPNSTGAVSAIELYLNGALVESLSDLSLRQFSNLLSNNTYELRVTYTYDLNDGNGAQTVTTPLSMTTLAKATPTLGVQGTTTQESVSFDLNITDVDTVGSVSAIELYQGETLVEALSDLSLRQFSNLLSNNTYEIRVTYTYDLNDGNGAQTVTTPLSMTTLAKATPTLGVQGTTTQESIAFDYDVTDIDSVGDVSAIELYLNGALVEALSDLSLRQFSNLLSNNTYEIRVTYTYDLNDGNGAQTVTTPLSMTTLAKATPTLKIENTISDYHTISFDLNIIDEDFVGLISVIELYQEDTLVQSLTDLTLRTFTGLLSNSEYEIRVTYTYDLNDGTGQKSIFSSDKKVYVHSNLETFHPTETEDWFGSSVALYENYYTVSALGSDHQGYNSGIVYLYKLDDPNFIRIISPSISQNAFMEFGHSISMYGDYIAVSAVGYDNYKGVVFLYKISDPSFERIIQSSDSEDNDNFGSDVSVYKDYIAIASRLEDSFGSVYVYKISDTSYERKIRGSNSLEYNQFGFSLDIYEDYLIVGDPLHDSKGDNSGRILVYKFSDLNYEKEITLDNLESYSQFGYDVSIWNNFILVGAPSHNDSGSAFLLNLVDEEYVREIRPSNTANNYYDDSFGRTVSIHNNNILVGAPLKDDEYENQGAAYLYNVVNPDYEEKIYYENRDSNDWFAKSLEIYDGVVLIGVPYSDFLENNRGSIYLFELEDKIFTTSYDIPSFNLNILNIYQDSISFDFEIIDPYSLGYISSINIYQDNELVQSLSNLDLREINNLLSNNEYQIEVIYTYDLLDGNGEKNITQANIFYPLFDLNNLDYSKNDQNVYTVYSSENKYYVDYNITSDNLDEYLNIEIPEEYKNFSLTKLVIASKTINNLEFLLEGFNTENLVFEKSDDLFSLDFENISFSEFQSLKIIINPGFGGSGTLSIESMTFSDLINSENTFRTLKNVIPEIHFTNVVTSGENITFDLFVNDSSDISNILFIQLYDGANIFKTTSDKTIREFSGLDSSKNYILNVVYSYDLNDGNGLVIENTRDFIKMAFTNYNNDYLILISDKNKVYTTNDGYILNLSNPQDRIFDVSEYFNFKPGENIIKISGGANHYGLLTDLGNVYMWGNNYCSKVWDLNASSYYIMPVNITPYLEDYLNSEEKIIDLSLGSSMSAIRTNNNRIFTWGENNYGNLGNGENGGCGFQDISEQFNLENDETIEIFKVGNTGLLSTSKGRVFMWGYNGSYSVIPGFFGDNLNVPTDITSHFNFSEGEKLTHFDARFHGVYVTNHNRILTIGSSVYGKLGNGQDSLNSNQLIDISDSFDMSSSDMITSLNINDRGSVITINNSKVYSWGWLANPESLELVETDNTYTSYSSPVDISNNFGNDLEIQDVFSNGLTHMIINSNSVIYVWGRNIKRLTQSESWADFNVIDLSSYFTNYK